jgi:hypothetical protein
VPIQTDGVVQNIKILAVGDIATVQVSLQDGDIIATATTFVSRQDIREDILVSKKDDFFLLDDDDKDEEYDRDEEPYVKSF